VRSVQSVTYLTSDVGLMALVLVKPLASFGLYDITAPVEVDFLVERGIAPVIEDDAFLGLLAYPSGTLASAAIVGELHTFWG